MDVFCVMTRMELFLRLYLNIRALFLEEKRDKEESSNGGYRRGIFKYKKGELSARLIIAESMLLSFDNHLDSWIASAIHHQPYLE